MSEKKRITPPLINASLSATDFLLLGIDTRWLIFMNWYISAGTVMSGKLRALKLSLLV